MSFTFNIVRSYWPVFNSEFNLILNFAGSELVWILSSCPVKLVKLKFAGFLTPILSMASLKVTSKVVESITETPVNSGGFLSVSRGSILKSSKKCF